MALYLSRTLEKVILRASKSFPIIMLTGPRQVGKTTLLEEIQKSTRNYVTLDNLVERDEARKDPIGFLERYACPVLIDEIQYAPELLSYIKIKVDKEKKAGMFWLTGSQQFHLMKNVSESLAGRVAIFNLLGLSQQEEAGEENVPFISTKNFIKKLAKNNKSISAHNLYKKIWRGSFPFVVLKDKKERETFYSSYINTYIQRDVKDLAQIGNEMAFLNFLRSAAARTGQLINYADMARDVGVSEKTIKSWVSILRASNLIYILEPYYPNRSKRLTKTAKLYFLDTGLCAYLTGWDSPQTLENGAMTGAIFETFVVSELLKSYLHNGKRPPFFFYRGNDKKEIDLLIEQNGTLYPIEIKKTATPSRDDTRNFAMIDNAKMIIENGVVICLQEGIKPISGNAISISVAYI